MRRLALLLTLTGCGSSPPPPTHCMPGETRPCACSFGVVGTHHCNGDGLSFDGCNGCIGSMLPPDELAKACAMDTSCLLAPFAEPAAACVAGFEAALTSGVGTFSGPIVRSIAECASKATDCVGALDCVTQGHGPAWCMAHPGISCDADLLVACPDPNDWPTLDVQDCTALGMHCKTANGSASCTDGATCDPSSAPHCDGNFLVACDQNTHFEAATDCGATGPSFACKNGACVPPGASCSASDANRCSSTILISCYDGAQLPTDCSLVAATCTNGACVPTATDCDAKTADRCNGTSLEICTDGHWVDVPCPSIGFMKCGNRSDGTAACTN